MPIEPSRFEEVGEAEHVTKYQRTVKTPMPENDDGSGYTTEENTMTLYRVEGDGFIKVSKVSDLGWKVALYDADGELDTFHSGYLEDEASAHRTARNYVEERHA